jgi:hypothetical protein
MLNDDDDAAISNPVEWFELAVNIASVRAE